MCLARYFNSSNTLLKKKIIFIVKSSGDIPIYVYIPPRPSESFHVPVSQIKLDGLEKYDKSSFAFLFMLFAILCQTGKV